MPVQPDQPGGSQGAVISRTAPCLLPEMTHVSALLLPTITLMRRKVPSILPHKSHLGIWRNAGEHILPHKSHLGVWRNAGELHQPCRRCHSSAVRLTAPPALAQSPRAIFPSQR